MKKALEQQKYSDIAEIARIADAVSRILSQANVAEATVSKQKAAQQHSKAVAVVNSKKSLAQPKALGSRSYPKFVRDEDRLIKIGWSKKNRQEYEHRVPFRSALFFARYLIESVEPDKLFQVGDILPVVESDGNEIPSYQIYVTLAWLTTTGSIEKRGRDGYHVVPGRLTIETINDLWEKLPMHADVALGGKK